jgi:hypothetical protein
MRVALRPLHAHRIAPGQTLLWLPGVGSSVVPDDMAQAIGRRVQFRTIEEHTSEALSNAEVSSERAEAFARTLRSLASLGFFMAETVAAPPQGSIRPASIRYVAMVTRDRPISAARSLRSYIGNGRHCGRRRIFVVHDSSPRMDDGLRLRAALSEIGRAYGADVRYVGPRERARYVRRLAQTADVPMATVRVALLGDRRIEFSRGANTNGVLLDAVGLPLFCCDDDSFCRPARPGSTDAVELSSASTPIRLRAFQDQSQLMSSLRLESVDLISEHASWLGGQAAPLMAGRPQQLHQASPRLIELARGDEGTVMLTWSGLYGDSGSASSTHYLSLTGADRDALLAGEQAYRKVLQNRIVWKAPEAVTLTRSGFFQSVAFGLDNRLLLPPFMPFLRASDTVFGQTLVRCHDGGLIACLPWSVHHAPDPPRTQSCDLVWRGAADQRFADVVLLCLQLLPPFPPGLSAAARLARLGAHLRELAGLRPAEFAALLGPGLARRLSQRLIRLETLVNEYDSRPAYWAADARRALDAYERRLLSGAPLVPDDLGLTGQPGLRRCQRLLAAFGDVLVAWEALRDGAARLRVRGRGLSVQEGDMS